MRVLSRFAPALAAVFFAAAHGQVLIDTTLTLGRAPDALELPFSVPADGDYRLTLTDLGGGSGLAPRLARADAGLVRGSALLAAAAVQAADASTSDEEHFAAAAGDHRLVLIGRPTDADRVGSAGVRVDEPATGAVLLDAVRAFELPELPADSPLDKEVDVSVTEAGSYALTVNDFGLPQPLGAFRVAVVRQRDGLMLADSAGPTVALQIDAAGPEVYEIFLHAELASGIDHGLVGVDLRSAGGGPALYYELEEIGAWPLRFPVAVEPPAVLTMTFHDLGFPLPLSEAGAVLLRDGLPLASVPNGSGSASGPAPVDGDYVLYVHAAATAESAGSFGLDVTDDAGEQLVETVQGVTAPGDPTDADALELGFDVPSAGTYTLTLTDFGLGGFFDAFASVSAAAAREEAIVATLDAPGSVPLVATPGHYTLAILADPAGADGQGLLGVRVDDEAGATLYEQTAAVGSAFVSRTFELTSPQSVDVTLTDLGFPADFTAVKVAVTRGAERVGEIVGAGTFSFAASAGTYFVNLLATPDATTGYGTLGLEVRRTPPVPTVGLTASASEVATGSDVTLSWSSTDAAGCAASDAWSGARPPSGSDTIGPLNADSKFTLTCTGDGGSASASVDVKITASKRSGGGGDGPFVLLALAVAAAAALARRRIGVEHACPR